MADENVDGIGAMLTYMVPARLSHDSDNLVMTQTLDVRWTRDTLVTTREC
jgi:hypothetical protein